MKRLPTGIIILDGLDVLCISFSAGCIIAYGYKKYKIYRRMQITSQDPIVDELQKKSPIKRVYEKNKPFKLPHIRGGYNSIRAYSLMIKSKKIAKILKTIINARRTQKNLRFLQNLLIIMNTLLTSTTGLRIAAGGSLNYVQIILIAFPSTIGGFLLGTISEHPLISALLPLAIFLGRDIEDIQDPYEKCRILCKAAEEYQNKQLMLEMTNLRSVVNDTSDALKLPLDQVPLMCTENKLSLRERFQLKEIIRSEKAKKRVQHFSEFIKKFSECDPEPESVLNESMGINQKIRVKNV